MIDRLVRDRLDRGRALLDEFIPGAVVLIAHRGEITHLAAYGDAVRYADSAGSLAEPTVPMTVDTIFDLASITKLFTAAVALRAVEEGRLELDRPVSDYVTEFAAGISVRQLLIHTSGLPAVRQLWTVVGGRAERAAAVFDSEPEAAIGGRHVYSCVGYLVTGLMLERLLGAPLPDLVARHVTDPLGMADTGFAPGRETVDRVAATEDSSHVDRGLVRGEVHDEASWSLGGTGGNAGLFGTASDLLRFAEMLRGGGRHPQRGSRVLSPESVREMTSDQLPPALRADAGYGQGIGPRIADRTFMGTRTGDAAFGHTGFTGTSVVVDPDHELVVIVLANAVHPVRGRTSMGELRSEIADAAVGELRAAGAA